jgi:hypothetical protein
MENMLLYLVAEYTVLRSLSYATIVKSVKLKLLIVANVFFWLHGTSRV